VVSFYGSVLAVIVLTGAVFLYGKRRPVGTPVTWGEAIVGSTYIFGLLFLAYGIMPDAFLKWADGKTLNWRSDAVGIPMGPVGKWFFGGMNNRYISGSKNVLFPKGITFGGRGRILVNKQHVRDAIAATLYIIMLGVNMKLWKLWQVRGKKAAAKAAIEPVSSYGRPLVKKA
jgi:hypothetical protein